MAKRVAVIGSGGMGSWFARYFRSRGASVTVTDRDRKKARDVASNIRARYAPTNVDAARDSDIVVLATPTNAIPSVVDEILPTLKRNALLLDISAVKSAVVPSLLSAQRRGITVASIHPMFGPSARRLRGRAVIAVSIGKDLRGLKAVRQMFSEARILVTNPAIHDRQVAETLALPHFLNMAFATLVSRKSFGRTKQFAGRTFDLQMLLAETVATEPETSADIQLLNKDFDAVLSELQHEIGVLARIIRRRDRKRLVARYRQVRRLLSVDPEFGLAQEKFARVHELLSSMTRK